jgi:polysaccharide export outer membrane protein
MRRTVCLTFLVSVFSIAALGQNRSSNPTKAYTDNNNKQAPSKDSPENLLNTFEKYVIGPEDGLSILVWREPELSTKGPVRPDGKISVPLLNDIQASGLTPQELQELITTGLKKYINDPQVSVIVTEIRSLVVYVTGSVGKPGVYPLGGPMTVMELMVRAGGFGEFAKTDKVQILRKEGTKQVRLHFDYKSFAEGKDLDQNILLKSGDMVIVP